MWLERKKWATCRSLSGKGGAKKILAIANTAANRVELPASLEAGVTTYAQMLESVVRLPEGNGAPSSPFVMTGYANDVQTGTGSVTVSLCRKVARFDIVNQTPGDASEGLVVSKLQLQSVPAHAYLFKDGYNASEADARVDYPAAIPSTPGIDATYYVLPVPEAEKMQLLVEGTLHGEAFAQTLDIQPQDVSGTPQGSNPTTATPSSSTARARSSAVRYCEHRRGVDAGRRYLRNDYRGRFHGRRYNL